MEYLRVQDGYVGDLRALATLKRELRIRQSRLDKVLHGYGLFECNGNTFHSPQLDEVMKPFEQRRARIEAFKRQKQEENSLKISGEAPEKSDMVSFEGKGEGKGKERKTTSSLKEKDDDGGLNSVSFTPPWERYVDELRHEESWIELMAMRSGLGKTFVQRFDEVLRLFKEHVQSVAHESHIVSPSEAKRYFCFYNTPGSAPFRKLVEEFQKPVDKGKYRFEEVDSATGQRSYCGVPIPVDAPPRPNNQAVWCDGKWVY